MISWIQNTFQKHFRTVFLVLLAVMTISLVSIYSASGGLGRAEREIKTIEFFGRVLTTEGERAAFYEDGQASFFLNSGSPYMDPDQIRTHAQQRAAGLHIADRLGVPEPTEAQLDEFVRSIGAFVGPDGEFDAQRYAMFRDSVRMNPGAEGRLARVLRENWRITNVVYALGGPGYVTDEEIKSAIAARDTQWSVETATLDISKVEPPAEPTEEQLQQWFHAYAPQYRTPDRVRVSYVEFRAADFASKSPPPTDEQIVAWFNANKDRYRQPAPPPAEGEAAPATPPEPRLEDVREQVKADVAQAEARKLAEQAANDFSYTLFDEKIQPHTPAFDRLLGEQGLLLRPAPPISLAETPSGLAWGRNIREQALQLKRTDPISDPLVVGENTVVLFFEEAIPAGPAEFVSVRDRVRADLMQNLRQQAVLLRGQNLRTELANAVGSGGSFAEAAKAAGLETKAWKDFSLRNRPPDIDFDLGRLQDLAVGEVSPMAQQANRGTFLLVTRKAVPEIATTGEDYEQARLQLMARDSQALSAMLVAGLARKEAEASGLAEIRQ